MQIIKLHLLILLAFGISHCMLETSGTSSPASSEEPVFIKRSRDSEHARNKDKSNEGGTLANVHGFTFKKRPAVIKGDKNILLHNFFSINRNLQTRFLRRKRFVDVEKKHVVDGNLLQHVSKQGNKATTKIVAFSVVNVSSKKQQSRLAMKNISKDNLFPTKMTSTRPSSYLIGEDPRGDESSPESESFSDRNETLMQIKNISSTMNGHPESTETDSVEKRYHAVPEISETTIRIPENIGVVNVTSNKSVSHLMLFTSEMNDLNWTTESIPKNKSNLLDVKYQEGGDNTSTTSLSTMSTPRHLYYDNEDTLGSKKYASNPRKRKIKNQTKTANDQHARRYKPHESVTTDHWQTTVQTFPNSTDISNISLEVEKKISSENIKKKIDEEYDDKLKSEQKEDSLEVQNEEINDKEDNESSECPTCVKSGLTEEDVKLLRLNMFKDLLAQKLRINQVDHDMEGVQLDGRMEDRVPKLPQSILEQTIKDNVQEIEKDQFYARDQEVIITGEDIGRECLKAHVTGCYSFSLRDKIKYEVNEAQLMFYKMKDAHDAKGQTIIVSDLELLKSGDLVNGSVIAREDIFSKEGWISINITKAVLEWVDTKKDIEMLAIRCYTCLAWSHKSLFGAKHGYKPLLIIKYATSNPVQRTKRSERCDPRFECCKRDLVVYFHDISMIEIYEPRNLSIGYCYGGCNEIHQYTYNHTALTQRLRYSNSYASHPTMNQQLKPCCVPLVLKDTFMITIEGNELIRKIVPKVIVETCGCM